MSDAVSPAVRKECRILTRYLAGVEPDEFVVQSWARGLVSDAFVAVPTEPIDRVLLSIAARGPFAAGLADAWARRFRPAGQLRRRLILLVAILESTSPGFQVFEPAGDGRIMGILSLVAASLGFGWRFLLSIPLIAIVRRLPAERFDPPIASGARTERPS